MLFLPLYVADLGITSVAENGIWSGLLFSPQSCDHGLMSPVWGTVAEPEWPEAGTDPALLECRSVSP
jgi:hypothetical protein